MKRVLESGAKIALLCAVAQAAPALATSAPPELLAQATPASANSAQPELLAQATLPSHYRTSEIQDQGAQHKPTAIELADGTIKIGFTLYADYAYYLDTGVGPQFVTQVNPPGPGVKNFSSFDVTRTYLNFFYMPSKAITMRITPNVFRDTAPGSGNGSLTMRIKYAYVDFNTLFGGAMRHDVLTVGQQVNPLIDWEEGLYGYRFVNLVPWNYISLSSTHAGISVHGPLMFNNLQYVDYAVGVFNEGSFHNTEVSDNKQVMARATVFPFGATSRYDGLGFTAFVDFGVNNAAANSSPAAHYDVSRQAYLINYARKGMSIALEYDVGRNAYSAGNLFNGTGPTSNTGDAVTGDLGKIAGDVLAPGARQRGFDVLGHYDIPRTPLALFATYQNFKPNTQTDVLDFTRVVAGVSYQYEKHLMFALSSQNVLYKHKDISYGGSNGTLKDINAVFASMQFSY